MPVFSFPIGSVLRVVTICTVPGQISANTRKWQLTELTGGASFTSTDFLADHEAGMAAAMIPLLSSSAAYYGSQVYLENPIGAPPRPDSDATLAGAGTAGAGLAPTQVAGLLSLYTATLGKTGQGRFYIPFPWIDDVSTDGTPTVGYQTNTETLGSFLTTDRVMVVGAVTGRFAPVMYPGGAAPIKFITGYKTHNAWATQRRRGSFGRTNVTPF